jgi:hypothetical protein
MVYLLNSLGDVIYTLTKVTRQSTNVSYNLSALASPYSSIRVGVGDRLPVAAPLTFEALIVADTPATRAHNLSVLLEAANTASKLQYLGYQRELLGLQQVTQTPVGTHSMSVSLTWEPATAYWTKDGSYYAVLP